MVGAAALGGIVTGVVIVLLTNLLSAMGPSGDGWSFRGNGALIVPFGLGPAILVGSWTALILHARGHAQWQRLGVGAGLVEIAIVLLSVLVLLVGGSEPGAVAAVVGELLQLLWMLAAPMIAALIRVPAGSPKAGTLWHLLAGIVLPLALVPGFILGGLIWRT
jgi:hypothetical protein